MSEIDFIPQFPRYPPAISTHLSRIARAVGEIESARVLPPQEEILRVSALAETIHFSTLLEGNELGRIEAERALRHELESRERAAIELVNYVKALERIESLPFSYTVEFILELHALITNGLGREGSDFQPRHEGAWRDGTAVVTDRLGRAEHVGVPSDEVESRMGGLMSYLERRHNSVDHPGPILAGVAHHAITDLHPFADGNGRTARAFAFAVLLRENTMRQRFFSPDRFYALDKPAYLEALRSAKRRGVPTNIWTAPGSLEKWLIYYVEGLAIECERTAQKVRALNQVAQQVDIAPLRLTRSQEHMISTLSARDLTSVSRAEYEQVERVSSDQANREIRQLVEAKLLLPVGKGRGVRYRLPGPQTQWAQWDATTIEEALRTFLAKQEAWPSRQQFQAAGLGGLYIAMSRQGGIPAWRRRFGH